MDKISDYISLNIKHTFSPSEMEEQGQLLAHAVQDKAAAEAEKKLVMGTFKDKIDKLGAEVKVFSGHVTNGFTYRDEPCELFLDYDTNMRVYFRKSDGKEVKTESFHQSDYQKKLDFDGQQEQIAENNEVGEHAEGDALSEVIENKKRAAKRKFPIEKFLADD